MPFVNDFVIDLLDLTWVALGFAMGAITALALSRRSHKSK